MGKSNLWLKVTFSLNKDLLWANAGHEVAWVQSKLSEETPVHLLLSTGHVNAASLEISSVKTAWTIKNSSSASEIVFDRARGVIKSWTSNGKKLLTPDGATGSALTPSFWRAPIDNDRSQDTIYWKRFGLDAMTSQLRSVKLIQPSPHEVEISSTTYLSPPVLNWGFEVTQIYLIKADDTVSISTVLKPTGKAPTTVPRIGLNLHASKNLSTAEYFGLGPRESYPDKRSAQQVGFFKSTVENLGVSYEVPQENGNRMDARFVSLSDERGFGLRAYRVDNRNFSWAAESLHSRWIRQSSAPL